MSTLAKNDEGSKGQNSFKKMTFFVASYNDGPPVGMIPKAASTSIRHNIRECTRGKRGRVLWLTNDEALAYPVRVAFIRPVMDRLRSAYNMFLFAMMQQCNNPRYGTQINMPQFECWNEFIDWALYAEDWHVKPFSELLSTNDGAFVPNRLHRLDELDGVWINYYPKLARDHKRVGRWKLPTFDYRKSDIRERYAEDFEICQQV